MAPFLTYVSEDFAESFPLKGGFLSYLPLTLSCSVFGRSHIMLTLRLGAIVLLNSALPTVQGQVLPIARFYPSPPPPSLPVMNI